MPSSASAVLDFSERLRRDRDGVGDRDLFAGAFAAAQQQLLLEARLTVPGNINCVMGKNP